MEIRRFSFAAAEAGALAKLNGMVQTTVNRAGTDTVYSKLAWTRKQQNNRNLYAYHY